MLLLANFLSAVDAVCGETISHFTAATVHLLLVMISSLLKPVLWLTHPDPPLIYLETAKLVNFQSVHRADKTLVRGAEDVLSHAADLKVRGAASRCGCFLRVFFRKISRYPLSCSVCKQKVFQEWSSVFDRNLDVGYVYLCISSSCCCCRKPDIKF